MSLNNVAAVSTYKRYSVRPSIRPSDTQIQALNQIIVKPPEPINLDNFTPAQIEEMSMEVLKKPVGKRSDDDIRVLSKYMSDFDFTKLVFHYSDPEVLGSLCQQLEYSFVPGRRDVFEVDEIGTKFYIILKGSVSVHIRVAIHTEGGGQIIGTKKVSELGPGQSFGELAIMDEAIKPRSATITCIDDSYFAVLERKPYQKLIGYVQRQQIMTQVNFLQEIPIFKHFSEHVLKVWVYLFARKVKLPYKAVLYREHDNPEEVFLIRSGQVIVTRKVPIAIQTADRTVITMSKDKVLAVNEKPPVMREVKFALLGPGQMFGDEEGFAEFMQSQDSEEQIDGVEKTEEVQMRLQSLNRHTEEAKVLESIKCQRETTVVVSSREAEIWAMPTKHFFPKLLTNQNAFQTEISMILLRKRARDQRVSAIQKEQSEYLRYVAIPKPIPATQRYSRRRSLGGTQQKTPQIFENSSAKIITEPSSPAKLNKSSHHLQDTDKNNDSQDQNIDNSTFMITELPQNLSMSPTSKHRQVEFKDIMEGSSPRYRLKGSPERSPTVRPMTTESRNIDSPYSKMRHSPERNYNEFVQSLLKSAIIVKHVEENKKNVKNEEGLGQNKNQSFCQFQTIVQSQIQEHEKQNLGSDVDDVIAKFSRFNLKSAKKERAGTAERGRNRSVPSMPATDVSVASHQVKRREVVLDKTVRAREESQRLSNKTSVIEPKNHFIDKWADVRTYAKPREKIKETPVYQGSNNDIEAHPLWRYAFVQKLVKKNKKKNKSNKKKDLNHSDLAPKVFNKLESKLKETIPRQSIDPTKADHDVVRIVPLEGRLQQPSLYKIIQQKQETEREQSGLNKSIGNPIQKIEDEFSHKQKIAKSMKPTFEESLGSVPTRNTRALSAYNQYREVPANSRTRMNLEHGRLKAIKRIGMQDKEKDEKNFNRSMIGILRGHSNKDNVRGHNKSCIDKVNVSLDSDHLEEEKKNINKLKAKLLNKILNQACGSQKGII